MWERTKICNFVSIDITAFKGDLYLESYEMDGSYNIPLFGFSNSGLQSTRIPWQGYMNSCRGNTEVEVPCPWPPLIQLEQLHFDLLEQMNTQNTWTQSHSDKALCSWKTKMHENSLVLIRSSDVVFLFFLDQVTVFIPNMACKFIYLILSPLYTDKEWDTHCYVVLLWWLFLFLKHPILFWLL